MKCYSVVFLTPETDDWLGSYVPATEELVHKHGGRYLARSSSHEQLEGEDRPDALRVIIEWPSKEAAHAWMNDPDYKEHLDARLKGSKGTHFLVEGVNPSGG
jgi:uncharacterized protein (DUF1330 family)